MRSSSYFKTISRILIFTMLHLCWLTSYGYAEMIPTESAVQSQVQDDRQRILDLLERQEVVDELEKYGVSKVEAIARINSLTYEEITQIAEKLDELAAGGGFAFPMFNPCADPKSGWVEPGWGRLIMKLPGCGVVSLVVFLIIIPFSILFCPFSVQSYGKCVGGSFDVFDHFKADLDAIKKDSDSKGETVVHPDCDPGMESCVLNPIETNSSDETIKSHPKTEVPCVWQFDSCMQWAGTPQQEEECSEDKQMCLQVYFPCDTNYSSCLSKVGRAISSEQYCVEEKQKCISKMMGK